MPYNTNNPDAISLEYAAEAASDLRQVVDTAIKALEELESEIADFYTLADSGEGLEIFLRLYNLSKAL